ncbi:MAG: helix-turn-helix transcriptional regulator [Clostridia bacterium]|nr:helix-turn-helix transcriptional regulator [Clostridia bacterium]
MCLSQNIKKFRLEKGLTQEQLATQLGISSQAVSKWETSETYPDGSLLVPLANALDTSLDVLFDNKNVSMKNLSSGIRALLSSAKKEERFHLVRDICWQIEKGLFHCRMTIADKYDPEEIKNIHDSSSILDDYGFTQVSNGDAPFFSVFPEYGDGFSKAIGNGEEMRRIFKILASPETMRAVLFLHQKKAPYVFEAEILAEACEIEEDKLDTVLQDLVSLYLVYKAEIEINGKMCTLYSAKPSHKVIALLLFARELNSAAKHRYLSLERNSPYLK